MKGKAVEIVTPPVVKLKVLSTRRKGELVRQTCYPPGVHSTSFELYRMRTDRHWLHQKLVAFARANSVKAAAREFGCSRNTVRKWLRRHVPGKPSALVERSRRPKHCPHQTPASLEGQIVKLRKQTGFGAERLKHEFQLPCSHNAIARIIRQHGLTRPRKKKPATKKQLRHVKRHWQLFGQHRYQVFTGYSPLLAPDDAPQAAALPIHRPRTRLRRVLHRLRR